VSPPDVASPVQLGVGSGRRPTTKKCVGNPPRQTGDPLAPPCVANFDGDNFGESYAGVTAEEVRVLVYLDGCGGSQCFELGGSKGQEPTPNDVFVDLLDPPASDEFGTVRGLRLWQRYFNDRFQTYNRLVHIVVHIGRNDHGPEGRRADAIEGFARVKPFATIVHATENADAYLGIMSNRGVISFLGAGRGTVGQPASYFARYPRLLWSFEPSIEVRARLFSSYVCAKVVGRTVSFSGIATDASQPRRLGLLKVGNENHPDLMRFAGLVRQEVEACGGAFVATADYANPGGLCCDAGRASENMAAFRQAGVTTIIWPGGLEYEHSKVAARTGYLPEVVYAGDGLETGTTARLQDPDFWSHAWTVSTVTRRDVAEQQPCFQAAKDADPSFPTADISAFACRTYSNMFQLFTAIQVAGPRLGPTSVDKGFHAIPQIRSDNPRVPACFYEQDDYTCVKDGAAYWWDNGAQDPDGLNGCYRMPEQGKRYLGGAWPSEDVIASKRGDDPCNLL
jgi:hypothetical protein